MSSPDKSKLNLIFPVGKRIQNGTFTGTVWVNMLVPSKSEFNCPTYNVIFEPAARTNWHKHSGGQILLVTDGVGYYQQRGKKAQKLRKGDVVLIPSDAEHWHGAASNSWFVHIGISTNPQKGDVEWLGPVNNEEYLTLG